MFEALGIVSPGNYNARLGELVVPVVVVANAAGEVVDTTGLFADQTTRDSAAFVGYAAAGPDAANVTVIQLKMPATANVFAYVDGVWFRNDSGVSDFRFDTADVDANTAAGEPPRNFLRDGVSAAPQAAVRTQSSAPLATGTFLRQRNSAINVWQWFGFQYPVRLSPGRGICVKGGVVNELLQASWVWREYPT